MNSSPAGRPPSLVYGLVTLPSGAAYPSIHTALLHVAREAAALAEKANVRFIKWNDPTREYREFVKTVVSDDQPRIDIAATDFARQFPDRGAIDRLQELRQDELARALSSLDTPPPSHDSGDPPPVATGANSANTSVVFSFPPKWPVSVDIRDLAFALACRGAKSKQRTALEFTRGDKRKAESLLSRLRRYERKTWISGIPA